MKTKQPATLLKKLVLGAVLIFLSACVTMFIKESLDTKDPESALPLLTVTCGAKMAGFIVGAKCPIVMTSRGSSAQEKYLSIVISAAAAR